MTPTTQTASSRNENSSSATGSARIVLNAFKILNPEELSWNVTFWKIRPLPGKATLQRVKAKSIAFEARQQFKNECRGLGFFIEIDKETVAVPGGWRVPDGAIVGECTVTVQGDDVVSAKKPIGALFGQILKEGIKEQLKKSTAQLGQLWQDYNDFCAMPDEESDHGFLFCKKFNYDAKPLCNEAWVIRFSVNTIALDGRTFESYYSTGEADLLADMVLTRLNNQAPRSDKPASVRVWFDQRPNGGAGAKVFELDNPSQIIQHGKLSPEEQKGIAKLPVACLNFNRPEKLASGQLRLLLDTQITQEDHDETIVEPAQRGRITVTLRNAVEGCQIFGRTLKLSQRPIDNSEFRSAILAPPSVCVRSKGCNRIIPPPSQVSSASLDERVRNRMEHIRNHGFIELRMLKPLLAVPSRLGHDASCIVKDTLNRLLDRRGIAFSFDRFFVYRNPEEVRVEAERGNYDAVLAVLPESRRDAPNKNDNHEQLKKKLVMPSQCIYHDTLPLRFFRGRTYEEFERADRQQAMRCRNRLDLALGNLLVKAHCFPFIPADPFHYNLHVGIDVGGQLNNQVMACMGYGFNDPMNGLFFKPVQIPMDLKQAEPVHPDRLFGGLLQLFEETHSEVTGFGDKPNFSHVLFIRDGQLQGSGDEWNEVEALQQLHCEALNRGWIDKSAVWTAVEIMKAAEGWRVFELNGEFCNPVVGCCCYPFPSNNEALLCTTGAPYLTQGTAAPLKLRVQDIAGKCSLDSVVSDLVWEADMCFTKPDMGQSLPWTLQIADTGALQLAKSYRISGITV